MFNNLSRCQRQYDARLPDDYWEEGEPEEEEEPMGIEFPDLRGAIIGTTCGNDGLPVRLVYDYNLCVKCLMEQNGWDEETALEWVDYNTCGTQIGNQTPVIMTLKEEWEDLEDLLQRIRS